MAAVHAGAALSGGHLAGRAGARLVFAAGAAAYLAGYLIFAAGPYAPWLLLAGFLLAGTGIGCAETSESTAAVTVSASSGWSRRPATSPPRRSRACCGPPCHRKPASPRRRPGCQPRCSRRRSPAARPGPALTRPDPKHHPRAASLMSPGSSRQMDEMLLRSGRVQAHRTCTAAYLNSAYSWAG
jgi:hypothetical protein